jgi:hypothetical protein
MKKIKYLLAILCSVTILGATSGTALAATDCADNPAAPVCQVTGGSDTTVDSPDDATKNPTLQDRLKTIVNILLFILGAIAVIVIVISGIRYATSGGDSSAVKGAKDTILYAVVGLIVAILAYAIVNFVLGQF